MSGAKEAKGPLLPPSKKVRNWGEEEEGRRSAETTPRTRASRAARSTEGAPQRESRPNYLDSVSVKSNLDSTRGLAPARAAQRRVHSARQDLSALRCTLLRPNSPIVSLPFLTELGARGESSRVHIALYAWLLEQSHGTWQVNLLTENGD